MSIAPASLIGLDERPVSAVWIPSGREGRSWACSQQCLLGFPFSGGVHSFEKLHIARGERGNR